jgi:hypothetical protein
MVKVLPWCIVGKFNIKRYLVLLCKPRDWATKTKTRNPTPRVNLACTDELKTLRYCVVSGQNVSKTMETGVQGPI